ncbi:MAG TPA: hypothetical protein VNC50_03235 [Planctomycetia bacterium]|nr:hypothetical protein [Planctomycetia bacterium]
MYRSGFAAGLALVVLGFAGAATAGEQVVLKGTLDGTITRTPIPPLVKVDVVGEGQASQLGRFGLTIAAVADPVAQTASGTYSLVAANGDTLFADFVGVSMVTDIPGVAYVVETATITGGTGRFAGATGGFIVERIADRDSGETYGSFEGTISSPGS